MDIWYLLAWAIATVLLMAGAKWLYGEEGVRKVVMTVGLPLYLLSKGYLWIGEKLVKAWDYLRSIRNRTVFREFFGFNPEDEKRLEQWFEEKKILLQNAFAAQEYASSSVLKLIYTRDIEDKKTEWYKACSIAKAVNRPHPHSFF